ncbi:GspH/FimT family pseudopilin [Hylemonella sp. W303a]|uniref:GspH/FimT family pseudopilin n=1 Tax=Hylemonella sp. W303a TaxID=3389873 RepID=UPI00396B1478
MQGFTLVELMLALAIGALLASLAAPAYQRFLLQRGVQAAVDALVGDLRYARSEALMRSARVSVCSSRDGAACLTTPDWAAGWIVFADANGDGVVDAADRVLRVQEAPPYLASLSTSALRAALIYEATGWARAAGRTFTFTPLSSVAGSGVRIVCVSNQGRAGARAPGTTKCS